MKWFGMDDILFLVLFVVIVFNAGFYLGRIYERIKNR